MIGKSGRAWLRHPSVEATLAAEAMLLPLPVARFQIRARRLAWGTDDHFSLTSATRPSDLRTLLRLARGSSHVVELGTASGWTAISLALAAADRRVVTYDLVKRPEPERYLRLAGQSVRDRVEFVNAPGERGPLDAALVGLLYIDSSHDRDQTVAEVLAWRAALRDHALVVFDDYLHPSYPGVAEAIAQLGLSGEQHGTMFVHRMSPHTSPWPA